MSHSILGSLAEQEIKEMMRGLRGAKAVAEAARLAAFYGVCPSRIYELSRVCRPPRRCRADKDQHAARVFNDDSFTRAAELVAIERLSPETALEYAQLNGAEINVSLAMFRRALRAQGINRKALRRTSKPFRSWEAAAPLDLFQFDISSVKERWYDYKTRTTHRITVLDDSKNHPYAHANRVRLWKFTLIDDCSRRKFVRFYAPASGSPDATLCIEFLLSAFREFGIPKILYTDRDSILRSERMQRAAELLNQLFIADGGFVMTQHLPGNAQATGKVERTHQIVETYEPLINLFEKSLGNKAPTLEALNIFAVNLCEKLNWTKHRTTGEIPMMRWQRVSIPLRLPPAEVLNAVFTADEHEIKVASDVTVSFGGKRYQLPRNADLPFVAYALEGKKLKVITMRHSDFFLAVTAGNSTYEIELIEAKADTAGDFKTLPETIGETAIKRLKESHKARRAKAKEDGTRELIPGFDAPFKTNEQPRPAAFPKPQLPTDPMLLAALSPAAASLVSERRLTKFKAMDLFILEGLLISDEDKAWFKCLFSRSPTRLESELRAEIETHRQREATRETITLAHIKSA